MAAYSPALLFRGCPEVLPEFFKGTVHTPKYLTCRIGKDEAGSPHPSGWG